MDDVLKEIRRRRGLMSQIARELGINRAAIAGWKRIPPKRVIEVARITGMTPHQLRPDLYPSPSDGQ